MTDTVSTEYVDVFDAALPRRGISGPVSLPVEFDAT
jgi:hypothetical protein